MRMLRTTSDGSSQIQTPQHLMERVRGSQDGERKTITVLFAIRAAEVRREFGMFF